MNVSSYKEGGCKTLEKIVAVLKRKSDIILLTDCRLKGSLEKVKKIFRLGKGFQYDLYSNSTRSERGVCIAINRGRDITVLETISDALDENYLILRCNIEGKEMLLGGIYGPNTNNVNFYRRLRDKIESKNIPFILGGDFNTVLDGGVGEENLDLEDRNTIPQKDNGKYLREWISEGNICDPFRKKYPMARSMSYVPFRKRKRVNNVWVENDYGKSRLDFYLISNELYNEVNSIFYGERLSKDMDHLEVILKLGSSQKRRKETVFIRNDTLDRGEINDIGVLGFLDCVLIHKSERDDQLQEALGVLQGLYINKCNMRMEQELNGTSIELEENINNVENEWVNMLRRMGDLTLLNFHDLQCSATTFFEVLLIELKNRVIALQGNIDSQQTFKRKWLAKKLEVFSRMFPPNSEQVKQ